MGNVIANLVCITALQQGSGINFITGYGVYFFSEIGIKVSSAQNLIRLAAY